MKIISHRGNLNGPESETENSPQKIEQALKLGYECEIDVWYESGNFTLCHDFKNNKRYNINAEFLKKMDYGVMQRISKRFQLFKNR